MAYTAPTTRATGYVVTATNWNELVNNWLFGFTAAGLAKHEIGGNEVDQSAIADGGIVVGTGAGTMAIRAAMMTAGAAGFLKHEVGGLEFDASAITTGGLIKGDSAGVMELLGIGAANQALRVNSGGTDIEWSASQAQIATGTYTGDGATSQAITGVGFAVRYVITQNRQVNDAQATNIHWTSDTIVDDNASGMAMTENVTTGFPMSRINRIISLDADGFTVDDAGADEHPNKNAVVYNYIAFG